MDRRSFVKAAVGVAAAGAATATGVAMTVPLAKPRPAAAKPVPYIGLHKVGGPAPRGTPLIPIFVNADGDFEGRPMLVDVPDTMRSDPASGEVDVLTWYKYCGHQEAPGLTKEWSGDSVLRYFIAEDKLKLGLSPWFKDR
ncbi:MAG TPA: twin-arginine translocation signal domain-containing protein, partial [Candidatus Thermoplasmatota archaeon]|nr:twin-arginine translocation signal domain-containing protein [Candidatus Thermoplasmatota archaeon]